MAPPSTAARRKSSTMTPASTQPALLITLKLSPERLRAFPNHDSGTSQRQETTPPALSTLTNSSSTPPASMNGDGVDASTEVRSDAANTPDPTAMPPPKKGIKRGAEEILKARARRPKKRPRREDGTIDPVTGLKREGAPKGINNPRHNTGAINAGLRALDRSGRPCRKWTKGGFQVKSFTGVAWQLPTWKAPPKSIDSKDDADSLPSTSSNKENKDGSQGDSVKSHDTPTMDLDKQNGAISRVESPSPVIAATA